MKKGIIFGLPFLQPNAVKRDVLYFWGRLGFDNEADFLVSMSCVDVHTLINAFHILSGNTSYALAA